MEYPFKNLMPLDEATARTGYYKDWTHIDADTFHQISELVKFIREKGYGADTREAIAQALERVYYDAMKSGNADMELSMARKHFKDLASRLDASDDKLTSATAQLAQKITKDRGEVSSSDLSQEVKEAMTGGSVAVVGKNAILTENIVDGQVTHEKTDFITVGKNLFNGTLRYGYLNNTGIYSETEDTKNDRTGHVTLKPNTTYTISKTTSSAFRVGVSSNRITPSSDTTIIFDDKLATDFTFTTDATQCYLVVYLGNVTFPGGVSEFLQVELGSQATEWEPHKKTLKDISVDFILPSKNIFDGNFRQGYLVPDGRYYEGVNVKNDRSAHMRLKPNTTYTISKTPSSAFRVAVSDSRIAPSSEGNIVLHNDKTTTEFTFTTDENQSFLVVYVGNVTLPGGVSKFMQVEEGSQRTEWVTKGNILKNASVPYFNTNANTPEYFGIKGDGVTDDSDGLNNYAYHLKEKGGGRLELPRKELLIKKTITIPSNTIVDLSNSVVRLGNNYNLSERVWRGGSQMKPYFVTEEGSENIVFKNFSIVGTKQDIRQERHIGLGVFDSKNVDVQNVNVKSINYNPLGEPSFGNIVPGIGLFIIRSEDVTVMGGAFDEGGYENIGTEHSKDIIIDGVHSGKAWRTSIQPHRATHNLKILNSTIYQETATADSGAMTLHGQDDIDEGLKNILISGNTIHGEFSTEPTYDYNALIQIMDGGTAENIIVLNNILKGNRTGIYGTRTDGFSVVGNNISLTKGDGIYVYRNSTNVLLDQNIVSTLDGRPLVDSTSIATLGTNIGF